MIVQSDNRLEDYKDLHSKTHFEMKRKSEESKKEVMFHIKQLDQRIKSSDTILKTKSDKVALEDLESRVNMFSDLEHLHFLKDILLPRVQSFSNKLDEYHKMNTEVKSIVRKFDETISEKANKTSFNLLKLEFEECYIK